MTLCLCAFPLNARVLCFSDMALGHMQGFMTKKNTIEKILDFKNLLCQIHLYMGQTHGRGDICARLNIKLNTHNTNIISSTMGLPSAYAS